MAIQYYASIITDHISKTPEGFLVCHDAPISRTGYQTYSPQEIIKDPDELREYGSTDPINVYRDPSEVFHPASMASFNGKSVTDGHPGVDVAPDNYSGLEMGQVHNVRKGPVLPSGERALIADLIIKDPAWISRIENGERPDLSCGYKYNCGPDENGLWRVKDIRGNHVALVPKGRAGSEVSIHDHAMNTKEPLMANTTKSTSTLWGKLLKSFAATATDAEMEEAAKLREEEKAEDAAPEQAANNNPLDERFSALEDAFKAHMADCSMAKDKAKDAETTVTPKEETEAEAEDEDVITPEEEEAESASDAEGESIIPADLRPTNPIPGADAALASLRSMKVGIAKSGNKTLIDSYNASVLALKPRKITTAQDGYKALANRKQPLHDAAPSDEQADAAARKLVEDSGAAKREKYANYGKK